MEINRNLIDFNFEGYILSTDDTHITQFPLESAPLNPLQCNSTMRKSEWDSLVHYNCLTKDPFSNDTLYFINNHMELIRIKHTAIGIKQDIEQIKLFQFPPSPNRLENVSLSIAGNGLILYCDGNGKLLLLKEGFSHYEVIYECEVQKNCQVPLLLLASSYRDEEQCVQCAAAQKLELSNGDGMTYRLWLIELCNSKPNAPSFVSDVSMGVGLIHSFTELALTSSLLPYRCFEGPDLLIHVENSYILMVESSDTEVETENISCVDSDSTQRSQCRDDNRNELKEIIGLSRFGIGYECDGSNVNSARALDPITSDLPPLEMRFQKASDVSNKCIDSRSDTGTNISSTKELTAAMRFQLENPTIESILGDVEECDATEENSFGTLLLFNCTSKYLSHHLRYRCSNYRFLAQAQGGEPNRLARLLFQSELHGIVYEPTIRIGRLGLRHLHTLPAFGYVQASKQAKKFMVYDDFARLAIIGEYERRVFVYSANPTNKESHSHNRKQNIVEFGPRQLSGLQSIGNNAIVMLTPDLIISASFSRSLDVNPAN